MTKMSINFATEIVWQCDGEAGVCSLDEFFSANDMDEAERADIFNALTTDTIYFGGGGAAPEFTIALAEQFMG